jgi:hypothetical protein
MFDVVIVTVPYTASLLPPAAAAILASIANINNLTNAYIDFNIDVNIKNDKDVINFCMKSGSYDLNVVHDYFQKYANQILNHKPKYVCISTFTYNCLPSVQLLCMILKSINPKICIIIGGQGLGNNGINEKSMGSLFHNMKLCDYYVKSEGESALDGIFKNKNRSGINSDQWEQMTDLEIFKYPNYDNYNFTLYKKILPITGSRGCVRKCTFCDIHTHWKKFIFRDGKNIANEMISQAKKYSINEFYFTDSLVNGSMKAYREMVNILSDSNKNILWNGQFIVRSKRQMTEHDWMQTANSGANRLSIGIESLDESIRDHMKKKFSNNDVIYNLEMMKKYNIKCTFLMIVGYITETEKTFQNTMRMFTELKRFSDIMEVCLGSTLGILPNTALDKYNNGDYENDWHYKNNTFNTRKDMLERLTNHVQALGFHTQNTEENYSRITSWKEVFDARNS